MEIELTIKKKFEVDKLHVSANVRYWEDASVNDIDDNNGELIPCRVGDLWQPIIELETGLILNWDKGVKADIHYKVCDEGVYTLLDKEGKSIKEIDGYVPKILYPNEMGSGGDYIIMHIDESGLIRDYVCDLRCFINDED